MKRVFPLLMLMVISVLGGCASLPPWAQSIPVLNIAWHKGHVRAPVLVDGVCHVFSRDSKEALPALGVQVKSCFDGSVRKSTETILATKVVPIAWHRADRDKMANRYVDVNGMPPRGTVGDMFRTNGFVFRRGGVCYMVAPDVPEYFRTVGHETKHCFDGQFHDDAGNWY